MGALDQLREPARITLATIRLVNGFLGLLAPGFLARQIGVDPEINPGIKYVFRMFGIRTIFIGAELLFQTGDRRTEVLQRAVVIHASDTLAAWIATRSVNFPRKHAIVWISATNTVLALIANRYPPWRSNTILPAVKPAHQVV